MSRQVVSTREVQKAVDRNRPSGGPAPLSAPLGDPAAPGPSLPSSDDYRSRLVKYIPTEIIALYLTLAGVLATVPEDQKPPWIVWAVFFILLLLTPLYLSKMEGVKKQQQLIISTACFFVWVFGLGGPFLETQWYHPWYGAMALPLFTFAMPLWEAEA